MSRECCGVLAVVGCLLACGGERPEIGGTVFADSAGVQVATTPAIDRPLDWGLTELFRLGGADQGPGSFSGAHPSLVGTDAAGRIFVLDPRQSRVEVFDREGRPVRMLGRAGGGPGELEDAAQLMVHPSGEVAVFDYAKRALVRWDSSGALLPLHRIEGFFPTQPMVHNGDTLIYVHEAYGERFRGANLRLATPTDTVDFPGLTSPTSGMIRFSCVGLNLPPLFTRSVAYAARAGRIALTLQAPYQVDLYEGARLVVCIRRDIRSEPVTVGHVERLHPGGMKVSFGGGASCTVPAAELMEKQGVADELPLVRAVALDPVGRLWVERYTFHDEPGRLDLFGREGSYLGTLTGHSLPLGFIGEAVVLFAEEDAATGITRVVAYRIAASAP